MKISYDPQIDALYIRRLEGVHQCKTLRLTDEVALNIGKNAQRVGIEVLDAKEVVGEGSVPSIVLENVPLVARPIVTAPGYSSAVVSWETN